MKKKLKKKEYDLSTDEDFDEIAATEARLGRRKVFRDKVYQPPTLREKWNIVQASCFLIASCVGVVWSSLAINSSLSYQREADIELYKEVESAWNTSLRAQFASLNISVLMPDSKIPMQQFVHSNESHLLNTYDEFGDYPEYEPLFFNQTILLDENDIPDKTYFRSESLKNQTIQLEIKDNQTVHVINITGVHPYLVRKSIRQNKQIQRERDCMNKQGQLDPMSQKCFQYYVIDEICVVINKKLEKWVYQKGCAYQPRDHKKSYYYEKAIDNVAVYRQLQTSNLSIESYFPLVSSPLQLKLRHSEDPLLYALSLTPVPGTFDFGDSSFGKFQSGVIFLTISLIALVSVCIYIYRKACDRNWEAPKVKQNTKKKIYQYEDDKRIRKQKPKIKQKINETQSDIETQPQRRFEVRTVDTEIEMQFIES